jgi:uncharacterized LabA/DUF88 family protein/prefoldin subunit 5
LVNPEQLEPFGPAAWLLLIDGAVGRSDLDKLYRNHAPKSAPQAARLARHQVVGAVVGHALKSAQQGQHSALRSLSEVASRRSRTETRLLAALAPDAACDKLSTYGGMQFKRQRARMIWAALSDDRDAVKSAGLGMLKNIVAVAESGEQELRIAAPSSTSKGPALPGLSGEHSSAKIGRLRRSLSDKDETIMGLREELQKTLASLASERGEKRRKTADEDQQQQASQDQQQSFAKTSASLRRAELELQASVQQLATIQAEKRSLEDELEEVKTGANERIAPALHAALLDEKKAWQHERQLLQQRIKDGDTPRQGVVLLIDAANIGAGARALGGDANFAAICKRLLGARSMRRCIAFAVADKGDERGRFESALQQAGIEVLWKDKQRFADGTVKADWDVGVAVAAMQWAGRAETVIIVSGDGDYLPLIPALNAQGTALEAAGWEGRSNAQWQQAVASFTLLDASDLMP